MAYFPPTGSVVAFQSDPTKLVGTFSVVGTIQANPTSPSLIAYQAAGSVLAVSGTVQTDVRGSVATVIIGGSIAASFTPPANQSVSGTVHIDNLSSVVAFQAAGSILAVSGNFTTGNSSVQVLNFPTNQSVSGTVNAQQSGTTITSLVSTVPSSVLVGASIIGLTPVQLFTGSTNATQVSDTNSDGSGAAIFAFTTASRGYVFNGSNWDRQRGNSSVGAFVHVGSGSVITVAQGSIAAAIVSGSIAATFTPPANQSVSGTVNVGNFPGITSLVSTVPSSVIVGASIFGTVPIFDNPSITGLKFTDGTAVNQSAGNLMVNVGNLAIGTFGGSDAVSSTLTSGLDFSENFIWDATNGVWSRMPGNASIGALVSTSNSSVITVPTGTQNVSGSVVTFQGTSPWVIGNSSVQVLNSVIAINKPFIDPTDANVFRFTGSIVSTSVTLIAASVASKKFYITDWAISNTGSVATLVTFKDGSTSIIGFAEIPPTSGNNKTWEIPLVTKAAAQDLTFQPTTATSILYLTINGYQA